MKKIFPLQAPGKADPRVVESVKNEIRKYVKRERRKPMPEGFTWWNFKCRAGADRDAAVECALNDIGEAIDAVVNAGGTQVYLEVLAEPGHRPQGGSPTSEG